MKYSSVMAMVLMGSLSLATLAKDPGSKPNPAPSRPTDVRERLVSLSCHLGGLIVVQGEKADLSMPQVRRLRIAGVLGREELLLPATVALAYDSGNLVVEAADQRGHKAAIVVSKDGRQSYVKVNGKAAFPGALCNADLAD